MKEMWEVQKRINENVQEQLNALALMNDLLNKKCNLLEMQIKDLRRKLSEKES